MEKANALKKFIVKRQNQPDKLIKYAKYLSNFAKKYLEKTDAQGYVLGISGGIDSALALAILANTPGIRVMGVFIDIESRALDLEDAQLLAKQFKFEFKTFNLTDEYRALVKKLGIENNKAAQSNLKVRLRSNALYALGNANNLLVCGTTNAAERLVGYYTKFGDNACDISLLYWLTKTNIYYLANFYQLPKEIISKKPSAGLFEGQTDETDLEITYDEIDHYLSYAVIDQIQDTKITTRYIRNKHKLNAPAKPKKFMCMRNSK